MLPLRTVLRANSAFSLTSGAALVFGAFVLDDLLGLPAGWLAALGAGVAAFGLLVRRLSDPDPVPTGAALFVIAADLSWVIGTAVVLLAFPDLLSATGMWVFGIIGLFVLDFALLQALGLRSSR
ncbi:MAG: hypothetical protein JSV07_01580 [Acidimicrobiia bacterium]|jgi:hypothetical protein|nr:MAG: hypothetical protein JSV07_01580 [Acidimicrobiia bacterium]